MNLKQLESGRSMVEILGTLAIIGVLSIGGIIGYSYGMDRYRANETVNDVMLRATDLIAQALQNNETLSLEGWNEKTVYPVLNADYATDASVVFDVGTQAIPIPKRVCEMVFDDLFPHTVQIDTNAYRGISKEACGDDNIMTFYFDPSGAGPAVCDPECPDGEVCDNGTCYKTSKVEWFPPYMNKTCTTNEDCQIGYTGIFCSTCKNGICKNNNHKEGESCTFDDGTIGQCAQGICQPKSGCTYTENICTGKNEYCASTNSSYFSAFPNGETGTCVTADVRRYEIDGRVYFISNPGLSYWDAYACCEALGLNFVPKEELYQNGKRTELTKTLARLCGSACSNMWNIGEGAVGDILGVTSDVDSSCVKNERGGLGGASAICR